MNFRLKPLLANASLILASIVVFLLAGEVGIRLFHPNASIWRYPNYIAETVKPDPNAARDTIQYDPELGYAPVPNSTGMLAKNRVTFSAEGFRIAENRAPAPPVDPILAVGDSFTEGWGVDGDQTWTADLEQENHRTVLNAGVRGYGLDQIYLRTERLLKTVHPKLVILAFIKEDIDRTGLSVFFSTRRPYYMPVGDGLELHNVPVSHDPYDGPMRGGRRVLGHSYLLDFTMRKLGLDEFWYNRHEASGADPTLVSCRLMHRFADLLRVQGLPGLVVSLPTYTDWKFPARGTEDEKQVEKVLQCARDAGLKTTDVYQGLAGGVVAKDPDAYYGDMFHFNAAGQALATKLIAAGL